MAETALTNTAAVPDSGRRQAWIKELAAMENAVIEINRALDDPEHQRPTLEPWTPAADLGPCPEDLRAYAGILQQSQLAAFNRLGLAREETARHLTALRAVPVAEETRRGTLGITG